MILLPLLALAPRALDPFMEIAVDVESKPLVVSPGESAERVLTITLKSSKITRPEMILDVENAPLLAQQGLTVSVRHTLKLTTKAKAILPVRLTAAPDAKVKSGMVLLRITAESGEALTTVPIPYEGPSPWTDVDLTRRLGLLHERVRLRFNSAGDWSITGRADNVANHESVALYTFLYFDALADGHRYGTDHALLVYDRQAADWKAGGHSPALREHYAEIVAAKPYLVLTASAAEDKAHKAAHKYVAW